MANHETKTITIYQKNYQLPILNGGSFERIQSQIKQRQQVIKNQHREIVKRETRQKKSLFGLFSKTETVRVKTRQKLTFEQKFQELERLVTDYNSLIAFLTEHKQVYQQFFAQLTNDLRQVVTEKLKEAQQQERERLQLLQGERDSELISILEGQKEQILANVWLFGKAFLLMLKKIELISDGIEKITSDQDTQKQLLVQMVERLGKYKKVYGLQRKISKSAEEAGKMAEAAVNLEQYLQPFIGSFQGLIDEVCQQDSSLTGTVTEIQDLVEEIMTSNTGALMSARADDLSKDMLDFLVANEEKKERLVMAVEEAQRQDIDWSWQQIDIADCGDLTRAITALQSHIDGKLGEYSGASVNSNQLSGNNYNNELNLRPVTYSLESEKNINYEKLETLLSQGQWKKADQETSNLMLEAMGKDSWRSVYSQDLLNFPVTDLRTIDQLWLNYSKDKFGFSVQKEIWIKCGGTPGEYNSEVAYKFADQVGWRKNEKWLSYSQLTFNTKGAPNGHLPGWRRLGGEGFGGWGVVGKGWLVGLSLFSRLDYNI